MEQFEESERFKTVSVSGGKSIAGLSRPFYPESAITVRAQMLQVQL